MRVLHVIPAYSPLDGGPAQAVLDLARAGWEAGHQADVAASAMPGEPVSPWPDAASGANGRLRLFPRPAGSTGWKFSWPLTRWVQGHARHYDLLHIHAVFSASALFSCLSALVAGRPYVLTPHGSLDAWSLGQAGWKKRPYLWLMRPLLARAKALHAASDKEARCLAALNLGCPVRVAPLAVDLPDDVSGHVSRRAPEPAAAPVLLFLARLHPVKALPVLLEALALLKTQGAACRLDIAGDGKPGYRAGLEARVRELGLTDRVRFLGFVEGEAKARAFAGADLFVLPSLQENFGLAAVEALGHGLPVVLSDQVPLGPAVLEHGAGEVARAGSAQALAEAVTRLLDPERRAEAGRKARALARNSFGREALRRNIAALYAEALGQNQGSQTPAGEDRQEAQPQRAVDPAATPGGGLQGLLRALLWGLRSANYVALFLWHGLLRARPMPLPRGRALVLAPHPDDESIGCGGLLAAKARAGLPVLVAVLTDGRYGVGGALPPEDAATLRRGELAAALAVLGLPAAPAFLGCPDGSLGLLPHAERDALLERLAALLREFRPDELYLPNPADCHADHEACLDLAREALDRAGLAPKLYGYFIWAFWPLSWHLRADKPPLPLLRLDIRTVKERKARAMACHASQMPRLPAVLRSFSLATGCELYCELDCKSTGAVAQNSEKHS